MIFPDLSRTVAKTFTTFTSAEYFGGCPAAGPSWPESRRAAGIRDRAESKSRRVNLWLVNTSDKKMRLGSVSLHLNWKLPLATPCILRDMCRLTCLILLAAPLFAQGPHLLLRSPALSRTQIVFSYAGDLWSVPREGGEASHLTTGAGDESNPVFSPDGTMIAFTGQYDGNYDVFVIPAEGGVPKRLTWHPDPDQAVGWTPDGKRVLFTSRRDSGTDAIHLFTVSADGGFPEELPLPIGEAGSYSPDGTHLAYVPLFQWQQAWKRYRGGQTRKIWLANLADSSVTAVPRDNSNDFNPMWVGDKVYFLSDRSGPVTLFSYDTRTKQVKQLVENHGLDFKSASAGPGAIVYEQFGSLFLYDLRSGQSKAVPVRVAGDLAEVRIHYVNVAKRLRAPDLSPTGARAVFEARGEIVTVPAEKGDARNISQTTGANERDPIWSPDGQTIAWLSDESGEYQLYLRNQDGAGEVKKINLGGKPAFYSSLEWSPDGKKILYVDNHLHLWYMDVGQQKPVLVDTDIIRTAAIFHRPGRRIVSGLLIRRS